MPHNKFYQNDISRNQRQNCFISCSKRRPRGFFKFAFPTGIIVVTGEGQVTNENLDTDCTIATSEETFTAILNGELNSMMAVMTGKVKISGDMTVAMKLTNLI